MNDRVLDELNYRLDEALDRGRQWVESDEFGETMEAAKEEVEYLIRKHPLKGLAVGLFAGYIAGKMFSS